MLFFRKKIRITIDPEKRTVRCNLGEKNLCCIISGCGEDDSVTYYRQIEDGHGVDISLSMLGYAVAHDLQYFAHNSKDRIKENVRHFEKETLRMACELFDSMDVRSALRIRRQEDEQDISDR